MFSGHWIEWIIVVDEANGTIVWSQYNEEPTNMDDEYAESMEVKFDLDIEDTSSLVPYEFCNKHGF